MRKLIYKITGFSFSIAAILGIIASVVGIIFVWRLAPDLTNRLVYTTSYVQKALDSTDELLLVANMTLTQAQDNVALIADATREVAATLTQTSTITSTVADAVGDEFIGVVENTQTALSAFETSAKIVDDTLAIISAIPFIKTKYSKETPLSSSVTGISESLDGLPKTLRGLQDNLDSTARSFIVLNDSVTSLAKSVDEIETSLQDATEVVTLYQELVNEAQVNTARVIVKLPAWVRWAAVGLTLLLVWMIVIQAGLLMLGGEMAGWGRFLPPVEQHNAEEAAQADTADVNVGKDSCE